MSSSLKFFGLLALALLLFGCRSSPQLAGTNKLLLGIQTAGGMIPFELNLDTSRTSSPAWIENGPDSLVYNRFRKVGDSLLLYFDALDSYLILDHKYAAGRYEKRASKGRRISMPVSRLEIPSETTIATTRFDGEWNVQFYEDSGPVPATGVFANADGKLRGTFLTETGDFRFLEGIASENGFALWTFDIAHAYFFTASSVSDTMLEGLFFAYGNAPVRWTAIRGSNSLRDPLTVTKLKEPANISFAFPDTDGTLRTHRDEAFARKPMLVYLFGSWCPNCADEARLLATLYPEFNRKGIEFVGLAFEYSGNPAEDVELVKAYRQRFGITWPTLLAGTSDKTDASTKVPFIEKVVSFPTSFFVRADGSIAAVHTGFSGPGTGAYYTLERQRFIQHLEELLR